LGVASTGVEGTRYADFTLVVSDHYGGLGLGTELLRQLIQISRDANIGQTLDEILPGISRCSASG
jgi:hypothetical protein